MFPLLRLEHAIEQQLGHADHAIERCSQFMAHRRQEGRLGAGGGLSLIQCSGQLPGAVRDLLFQCSGQFGEMAIGLVELETLGFQQRFGLLACCALSIGALPQDVRVLAHARVRVKRVPSACVLPSGRRARVTGSLKCAMQASINPCARSSMQRGE